MRLSRQIKPISYLKAHAPEIVRELAAGGEPYVITVHGEAKAVLMDVVEYERMRETLALLQVYARGKAQIARGETVSLEEAFDSLERDVEDAKTAAE